MGGAMASRGLHGRGVDEAFVHQLIPVDQLQTPIHVLHQGRSAFDPVAIVALQDAIDGAHFSLVDVTTHHALVATPGGFVGHGLFKVRHITQGLFDLVL